MYPSEPIIDKVRRKRLTIKHKIMSVCLPPPLPLPLLAILPYQVVKFAKNV